MHGPGLLRQSVLVTQKMQQPVHRIQKHLQLHLVTMGPGLPGGRLQAKHHLPIKRIVGTAAKIERQHIGGITFAAVSLVQFCHGLLVHHGQRQNPVL